MKKITTQDLLTNKQTATLSPLVLAFSAILALPVMSTSVFAQENNEVQTSNKKAPSWQINLQDADVKAFVNEVSDITGRDFVIDPRVNGKVTVVSHRPLTRDEVYELFLGVLDVNGIIALPSVGNAVRLVPENVAKQKGVDVDLRRRSQGNQLVTRIIQLRNTKVSEILPVIRPLMPQFAHIAAVPSVNALVVSNKSSNIDQIEELIYSLDGGTEDDFEILQLRYTSPESMLEIVGNLAGISSGNNSNSRLRMIADESNDRLIVKGTLESRSYIKRLVQQLDTKPTRKLSGLKVFKLKYASASHVAEMLRGLINNESLNSTGATNTLSSTSALSGNKTSNSSSSSKKSSKASSSASVSSSASSSTKASPKPFSIIADETQNAIVVNASANLMQEITEAISALDTRRAQVLIQAAIVEVSGNQADQLGIQWVFGGPKSGFGVTNFGNNNVSVSSLAAAAALASTNPSGISTALSQVSGALLGIGNASENSQGQARFYGAILQAIKSSTSANILSMPSIITLDNEEANILVGQNVPFQNGTTTNTTGSTTTIERKDVGINLTVIPHIGDNGSIRLEVSQEVSSVEDAANTSSLGIITNRRFIKTMVLAEDQQTIVLGGLMSDEERNASYKVPLLGDMPVVGRLFRSDNSSGTKRNLIVFLQPTILHNGSQVSEHSQRRYEQLKSLQLELDGSGNLNKVPNDFKAP